MIGVKSLVVNVACVFCVCSVVFAEKCNFNVKLQYNLRNEGFHRNLTYGIVFIVEDEQDQWFYHDCMVALDQTLPRGVYVNPDELDDLRRAQKVTAVPQNKVNVELPAEDSEESSVLVMGKLFGGLAYLWLPIHARYHRARVGGGAAHNKIEAPNVYLHCPDQRLKICEKSFLPPVTVQFLCNGSSKEKCSWKRMPFSLMNKQLIWEVPTGNTDDYYTVAGVTSGIIVIMSMYLLKAIHEWKTNMNSMKSNKYK